jgi:hypothetical protein
MEGILLLIIGVLLFLYVIFEPMIDKIVTLDGESWIILWYNSTDSKLRQKRAWIKLFTFKK